MGQYPLSDLAVILWVKEKSPALAHAWPRLCAQGIHNPPPVHRSRKCSASDVGSRIRRAHIRNGARWPILLHVRQIHAPEKLRP